MHRAQCPGNASALLSVLVLELWAKEGSTGTSLQRYRPDECLDHIEHPGMQHHSLSHRIGPVQHVYPHDRIVVWVALQGKGAINSANSLRRLPK